MSLRNNLLVILVITATLSCSKTETADVNPAVVNVTSSTGSLSGKKNTVITFNGNNFITDLSKIQVKINGKLQEVLSATATSIQAKVLPNTGSGTIELFLNGERFEGPVFNYLLTYTVSSLTNGETGYLDGPVATAKLEEVMGIAMDPNDNLYIAQWTYPRVRKISNTLMVSNFVGNGTGGDVSGQGGNARVGAHDFVATDGSGNVYIADEMYSKIRKVDPAGNMTTFASGLDAIGIKVAPSGNIYVAGFHSIEKYSPTGSLIWRVRSKHPNFGGNVDGDTSIAEFSLYGNIEIDAAEQNIYVANYGFHNSAVLGSSIKKFHIPSGTITTIAGNGLKGTTAGPALTSTFWKVSDLKLGNMGGLYIADFFGNRLAYLHNGTVTNIIGDAGPGDVDGDASVAKIRTPHGLTFSSDGTLYMSLVGSNKIKKVKID